MGVRRINVVRLHRGSHDVHAAHLTRMKKHSWRAGTPESPLPQYSILTQRGSRRRVWWEVAWGSLAQAIVGQDLHVEENAYETEDVEAAPVLRCTRLARKCQTPIQIRTLRRSANFRAGPATHEEGRPWGCWQHGGTASGRQAATAMD